ncbi:MAG: hypothetical protein R3F34_01920 [Planctomycetota bacterium]
MTSGEGSGRAARIVLRCVEERDGVVDGSVDPVEVLGRATSGTLVVEIGPRDAAAVLREALGFTGADPLFLPGRGAALERVGDVWRLLSLNAVDPLHATDVHDDLYRPRS